MKRILITSIATVLCVVACGEKDGQLTARQQPPGAPADGSMAGKDLFVSLKDADNRTLEPNTKTTRHVLIGDESAELSVLCTDNFEKTGKTAEHIKILGGGQIIIAQDGEKDIPETAEQLGVEKVEPPKQMINFLCKGPAESTEEFENYTNVETVLVIPHTPQEVKGKFNGPKDEIETIKIACGTKEDLAKAENLLFPDTGAFPVKILMSMGTKILFETSSLRENGEKAEKTEKKYILAVCEEDPTNPFTPDSKETPKNIEL